MPPQPTLTPSPAPNEFLLKPTRHPMLWAAIAYSAGIVAGIYFVRPACWLIAAAAAFLAASIYFLTTRKWLAP
jgi:hypothetical protein